MRKQTLFRLASLMSATVEFSPGFRRLRAVAAATLILGLLPLGTALAAGTTLRVTPGSLSFGSEVFGVSGATSKPKTVTISNPKKKRAQPVTIGTLSLSGADPGDFAVEDLNNCSGKALEPGASCPVQVTFTPTNLRARTGTLTVTDSSGNSAKPVHLEGSGVRGALQFKPHRLSFGKVQRGTSSTPQLVTLSNKNPVGLEINGIAAGTTFTVIQNCIGTLAADSTCPVSVMFSPPAAKTSKASKLTGALILTDNAAASRQKVQLSGVAFGTAPSPTPTPTPSPTVTPTPTPTPTPSPSPTPTATGTPAATATPTQTPTPTPTPCAAGICGQVAGGLTPIANSSVTLYAVGGNYGSGATSLGTVTTGADGSFDLSSYACPASNPQTYITASGGNAGAGANSAIGLMAVLGPCSSLSISTTVTINESDHGGGRMGAVTVLRFERAYYRCAVDQRDRAEKRLHRLRQPGGHKFGHFGGERQSVELAAQPADLRGGFATHELRCARTAKHAGQHPGRMRRQRAIIERLRPALCAMRPPG